MQMMETVSEHVERTNSRFLTLDMWLNQSMTYFFLGGDGISRNPITIDEDEGFSQTLLPQNTPSQHPPNMEPRPAFYLELPDLRLRSSAAQKLFGFFCNLLLFGIHFVLYNYLFLFNFISIIRIEKEFMEKVSY